MQKNHKIKMEAEELLNKLALKAQTSRYFVNPFFEDSKLAAKYVTEEWILQQIKLLAEQISQRKISSDEYQKGPYVGPSGIAYSLLRVTQMNKNLDFTKQTKNILETQSKISSTSSNKSKYLTGRAGFYLIKFLANLIDVDNFKRKIGKLLEYVIDETEDNEILNGRAGFLAGFLMLRSEDRKKIISDDQIRQVLAAMLEAGREAELVHWCHGATGVLQMLLAAHLVFGEEKYLEAAKRCGNLIWKKGILAKGPGICHGIAGSGYGLLLLYRFTKEEEWLNKAKTFGKKQEFQIVHGVYLKGGQALYVFWLIY
uniref:Uncharacterized protein n=1 Tax=Meloidogyne javanica TaxID=6303 RepID=A0A915MIK3_MELJA